MVLAPLVGALVGLVVYGAAVALSWLYPGGTGQLVVGALSIALLAAITRGIHLDGLADAADGVGSGRTGPAAIAVMRRSDIGSFGAVTVTVTLVVQTVALSAAFSAGRGALALVGGCAVARLAMTWACRPSVPAASSTGLGAAVAGVVPVTALLVTTAAVGGVLAVLVTLGGDPWREAWLTLAALLTAIATSGALVRRCVHRFGGITGDVLGASCELAFATFVLVAAAG